jgi:hypothetical protein
MTADDRPCQNCEKPVHLPHDPPCEHGEVACPECGHVAVCVLCRLAAEREMFVSGEYDPRADPYYDHTRPPPPDPIARDGGYWWDGSWVPVPDPAEERDAELARLLDVDGALRELNEQAEATRKPKT